MVYAKQVGCIGDRLCLKVTNDPGRWFKRYQHHRRRFRRRTVFMMQLLYNISTVITNEFPAVSSRHVVKRLWIYDTKDVRFMLPEYPRGQRQVYDLRPSTHVAPLRHLWPRQSLDLVLHLVLTSSQPTNDLINISVHNNTYVEHKNTWNKTLMTNSGALTWTADDSASCWIAGVMSVSVGITSDTVNRTVRRVVVSVTVQLVFQP